MRFVLTCVLIAVAAAGSVAPAEELTSKELLDARKVYVAKCAKCHRFHDPRSYTEADWGKWMESMNRKSKLKPADADLLSRYLDSYRTNKLAGKPEDRPGKSP